MRGQLTGKLIRITVIQVIQKRIPLSVERSEVLRNELFFSISERLAGIIRTLL